MNKGKENYIYSQTYSAYTFASAFVLLANKILTLKFLLHLLLIYCMPMYMDAYEYTYSLNL